jgi:predicted ATP-grasp superfamily ATP-dependent carboligase
MENKNKIGALVLLGGIALLGYVYFKKNKPTVASSQAKGLQALSNYYQTGSGGFEETLIKGSGYTPPKAGEITIGGVEQSLLTNLDYRKLTPKEVEDLKQSIGTIPDPASAITNQIAQNMQNADFSNLSSLGIAGLTFTIPT